jgi:hypothetical protein
MDWRFSFPGRGREGDWPILIGARLLLGFYAGLHQRPARSLGPAHPLSRQDAPGHFRSHCLDRQHGNGARLLHRYD